MNERMRTNSGGIRFIRYNQLKPEKGIPFSRVHIDRLEKMGRFPRRIRLGTNTVAWREDEVDGWSAARQAEQRPARADHARPKGPGA